MELSLSTADEFGVYVYKPLLESMLNSPYNPAAELEELVLDELPDCLAVFTELTPKLRTADASKSVADNCPERLLVSRLVEFS